MTDQILIAKLFFTLVFSTIVVVLLLSHRIGMVWVESFHKLTIDFLLLFAPVLILCFLLDSHVSLFFMIMIIHGIRFKSLQSFSLFFLQKSKGLWNLLKSLS